MIQFHEKVGVKDVEKALEIELVDPRVSKCV